MNLCGILVSVYLLGEFGWVMSSVQEVQIAGESREKMKEVERANKKGVDLLYCRWTIEEPARIKADERKEKFRKHTGTAFTNIKPEHGMIAKWLWYRAKKAVDKYEKSKNGVASQFHIFVIKAHKSRRGRGDVMPCFV